MNILPIELWFCILEFVDDIDLQNLTKINHFFFALVSEPIVWKKLKDQIQIPRLGQLLGKPKASRQDLLLKSICKRYGSIFVLSRQISTSYIDPSSLKILEAQKSLNRTITQRRLNSFLQIRKSLSEIPFYRSRFFSVKIKLEFQLNGINLSKLLILRPSLGEIDSKKMIKPESMLAQMICPGVKQMINYYNH